MDMASRLDRLCAAVTSAGLASCTVKFTASKASDRKLYIVTADHEPYSATYRTNTISVVAHLAAFLTSALAWLRPISKSVVRA